MFTLAILAFYHPRVTTASLKEAVRAQTVSRIFSFEQTRYFSQPLDQMKIIYAGDDLDQWNKWNVVINIWSKGKSVGSAFKEDTTRQLFIPLCKSILRIWHQGGYPFPVSI